MATLMIKEHCILIDLLYLIKRGQRGSATGLKECTGIAPVHEEGVEYYMLPVQLSITIDKTEHVRTATKFYSSSEIYYYLVIY